MKEILKKILVVLGGLIFACSALPARETKTLAPSDTRSTKLASKPEAECVRIARVEQALQSKDSSLEIQPNRPPPNTMIMQTLKIEGGIANHAVLQQGQRIVINGTASASHHIRCELGESVVDTQSSTEGAFQITLPPMSPAGPLTLQIRDRDGCDRLTYCDIYIGNVYLLSGQSNMALTLGESTTIEREGFDHLIRQLRVKEQALLNPTFTTDTACWQIAEEKTLKNISAVGFYFARELQKQMPGIAIGLINASYGGTGIETWISKESLLKHPLTKQRVSQYEKKISNLKLQGSASDPTREVLEQEMLETFYPEPFQNLGAQKGWQAATLDDATWEQMNLPDSWSLAGYDCPGIFWFRRTFELPEAWKNKTLQVHLGTIDHQDIAYLNGIEIGQTGTGLDFATCFKRRCYTIDPKLLKAGKNQLAIRVTSVYPIYTNGGLTGPESEMYVCREDEPTEKISLSGTWKYKPEKLLTLEPLELTRNIGAGEAHSYHIMFDNMIAPIKNTTISAVLWYQGEANTLGGTKNYEAFLKLLVEDWRAYFNRPDLPFLIIQLPGLHIPRLFSPHSPWAKIREAQLQVGLSIGIPPIVIAELGAVDDLHPPDKSLVGKRAAMTALALQGDPDASLSGPVYQSLEKLPNGKVRLHFELFGSELMIDGESVNHLVIAGADNVFHEAQSQLESSTTLLVWSEAVANPEVVYYAWCENPASANLYNRKGQLASPFRTKLSIDNTERTQ